MIEGSPRFLPQIPVSVLALGAATLIFTGFATRARPPTQEE